MKILGIISIVAGLGFSCFGQHAPAPAPSVDTTLNSLLAGNQRFVSGKFTRPHQSAGRLAEVAKGQHPIAAILSCADSRVPPELLFDQGLGDLFTVRIAGNVAPDDAIASLEYAVAHLGPKLIIVLGHERCGAVDAALKGGPPEGHLSVLLDRIKPAASAAQSEKGDKVEFAVRANVKNVVEQLKSTGPILADAVKKGNLKVIGMRYDLDTGKVEIVQ